MPIAAAAVGAYGVPINWHGRTEEVIYVLEDAKPKVLVAHADLLAPIRALVPGFPSWLGRVRASSGTQARSCRASKP